MCMAQAHMELLQAPPYPHRRVCHERRISSQVLTCRLFCHQNSISAINPRLYATHTSSLDHCSNAGGGVHLVGRAKLPKFIEGLPKRCQRPGGLLPPEQCELPEWRHRSQRHVVLLARRLWQRRGVPRTTILLSQRCRRFLNHDILPSWQIWQRRPIRKQLILLSRRHHRSQWNEILRQGAKGGWRPIPKRIQKL
jgi:hypothetical protein